MLRDSLNFLSFYLQCIFLLGKYKDTFLLSSFFDLHHHEPWRWWLCEKNNINIVYRMHFITTHTHLYIVPRFSYIFLLLSACNKCTKMRRKNRQPNNTSQQPSNITSNEASAHTYYYNLVSLWNYLLDASTRRIYDKLVVV